MINTECPSACELQQEDNCENCPANDEPIIEKRPRNHKSLKHKEQDVVKH